MSIVFDYLRNGCDQHWHDNDILKRSNAHLSGLRICHSYESSATAFRCDLNAGVILGENH